MNFKEEEYILVIDESGILIEYSELAGAFRTLTTLKMILSQSENGAIEFVKIHDYPSIKNRGYMLDISRGRIPNLSHIKRIVDILADLKYNQLQLYMESLVFEYKNFPEYWESTKPSPTLNPLKEETLEFIDKIYDGYFDSFSADIVNIGMDEPNELGSGETKEACDKYIYNTKSEKSLADIVYRMGNYYLLEDYLSFNSTELNTIYRDSSLLTERKREGIERVLKYMTDIRRELDSVTADKDALEDAIFSCDLVIYLAKLIYGIHDNIEGEKENIIERYKKLWAKTSHDIGTEIFIDLLEKSFTDYTKSK